MNTEIVDLLRFEKGSCHIVMLLPRQKDGYKTGEKRTRARHYFVNSRDQWLSKVKYIKNLITEGEKGRIYSTYNPRSLVKGASNMLGLIQHAMVGGDYSFLMRGKGIIASCLKKKGTCFSRDYYMLDIDTKERKTLSNCIDIATKGDTRGENCFIDIFQTKNGYHMLIKPMDVRLFQGIENVEIKTDEFICVGF